MKTFRLIISSPDGNLFDGQAVCISTRGAMGDFAVMAGHAPFITTVKAGDCKIELEQEEKIGTTAGGILTVSKEVTTLLSSSFEWK